MTIFKSETALYSRYAIYVLPPEPLAGFGASWLGWDLAAGRSVPRLKIPELDHSDLAGITAAPRKYGLHGTLKAPFHLAPGTSEADLRNAVDALAATLAPAAVQGLSLARIGRFLALVPDGDAKGLAYIAQTCVSVLDPFRAPATRDDLARRRVAGLSPRQDRNLLTWGYPYVFEDFRFHITLTGKLDRAEMDHVAGILADRLPPAPRPFVLDRISLVGETPEGFRLIYHAPLTG